MKTIEPLIYEISDISKGFFSDFVRKNPNTEYIFSSCDERLFNLKRLSLEVFHRLFREPYPRMIDEDKIPPENHWALIVHQKLSDMPEFDLLCEKTDSDYIASGIAMVNFMDTISRELPSPKEDIKDPAPIREELRRLKSDKTPNTKRIDKLTSEGRTAVSLLKEYENSLQEEESHLLRSALEHSIKEASSRANDYFTAESVLGWDNNSCPSSFRGSINDKMKLAHELSQNENIRQVFLIAGRMLQTAHQKRRSQNALGMGDLAGVNLGNDVSRIIPSELQKLAFPKLRPFFYLGYIEKTLLEYEIKGKSEQAKGPVVLCVDISGSMEIAGRDLWAKALTIVLMRLAREDKRHLRIIHFASKVEEIFDLDPNRSDFNDILFQVTAHYNGGGTEFVPPLKATLKCIECHEGMKQADLIFVTDGECEVDDGFLKSFVDKKKELEFMSYGILLGSSNYYTSDVLKSFCDDVMLVSDHSSSTSQIQNIYFDRI